MFQHSTLPSVSVDITRNLTDALPRLSGWAGLSSLERLPLPRTFREYLLWLLILAAVTGLALLQVWVALQISQAELNVAELRNQYQMIEQENAQLLWEISHFTTLERVQSEAVAAGFVPVLHRRYVTPQSSGAPRKSAVAAAGQMAQIETPLWSVQMDNASLGLPGDLGAVWEEWKVSWRGWGQSIQEMGEAISAGFARQWAKIDLSGYLWIGSSDR
ncbi:MAG: hypothetical protein KJZ86_14425 [Caldilineaceae bacterium]|nr:hypothetical protein [Caldilineaceae bacterium]HRJ41150.1 hypothetical protein [Caldilineaceae bacterium]